jgi:hypothetical protein
MATPKIIADFETQLATALAVGGTSFTLASATDDDGVSLPAGLYYFTVDNGTSNKEYLAGTLSGTSVTSVLSVSRQGVETSGAARAHRVGASVIMTDFATYMKYMNEIALVSAPDASTIAKGVVEAATLAEVRARTGTGGTGAKLVVTPDVMDDLPTSDEKAALAGGSTFGTPSTTNKFITQEYNSSATGLPVVRTYLNAASPATWTKPTGLKYVVVEVQAAGGNGGTNTASDGLGGGGGGGGYSKKLIPVASLGATETVTIGAVGNTSSFGSHCSANAGSSGGNNTTGADGGTATGGDINITGGGGGDGVNTTRSGFGGSSVLSNSVRGVTGDSNGTTGISFGGGGSGSSQSGASGGGTGGAGGPAIVIVTEYYS